MPFLTKCVYTIIYHINHFRQGNIMNKNINVIKFDEKVITFISKDSEEKDINIDDYIL